MRLVTCIFTRVPPSGIGCLGIGASDIRVRILMSDPVIGGVKRFPMTRCGAFLP
jgi:hypothetical protein